jgi:plastocyanin
MRSLARAFILLATLGLVACGSGSSPGGISNGSTLSMGSGVFSGNTNLTVKAGNTVTFDDSSGGPHHLVTGTNGQFASEAGAPSAFATSSGVSFSGGDMRSIVFPTAGTFNITCTIHTSMQATITVTP